MLVLSNEVLNVGDKVCILSDYNDYKHKKLKSLSESPLTGIVEKVEKIKNEHVAHVKFIHMNESQPYLINFLIKIIEKSYPNILSMTNHRLKIGDKVSHRENLSKMGTVVGIYELYFGEEDPYYEIAFMDETDFYDPSQLVYIPDQCL